MRDTTDELLNALAEKQQETDGKAEELRLEHLDSILEESAVFAGDDIPKPQLAITVCQNDEDFIFGTLGNISCIIGKAKSRKSFAISIATAAALSDEEVLTFKGYLPEGKQTVLYFDTEQGKYHVQRIIRRIMGLLGRTESHPPNLLVYCLRRYSYIQRREIIEHAISRINNVGLVIVDGYKDLIPDINDPKESTQVTELLMRLTDQYNVHMTGVLHENKGDGEPRGHFGTELKNKAEMMVSITKPEDNKHISVVKIVSSREQEFDEFAFEIDGFGLPHISDYVPPEGDNNPRKKKAIRPADFDVAVHFDYLDKVFKGEMYLGYSELWQGLQDVWSGILSKPIGTNKAKEFLKYYKDNLIIQQFNSLYTPNDTMRNQLKK